MSTAVLAPDRSPTSAAFIRETIDAVAAAGFDGVSMWTDQHDWAVADGMSSGEFFEYHEARGLTIPASEVVFLDWAKQDRDAVTDANAHILEVSAKAGARYIIAVILERHPDGVAGSDAGLGHLCDLAANLGLDVSFEFLPWSGVPDLASAVKLVERADRENLGYVIDAWHWFRQPGGEAVSILRSIPPERIHLLQLNDASATPTADPATESAHRLLPGDGAIDLFSLLDALAEMGAQPVVASEVFSQSLIALGPAENAKRQFEALRALVERYSTSEPPV